MQNIKIIIDGEISINDIEKAILELHFLKNQIRHEIHKQNTEYVEEELKEVLLDRKMTTFKTAFKNKNDIDIILD